MNKYEYKVQMKAEGKWRHGYYPYGHDFISVFKTKKDAEEAETRIKNGWREFAANPDVWAQYNALGGFTVDPNNIETRILCRSVSDWEPLKE